MMYVFLGMIGLSFGSFVNALVWRIHQQSLPPTKRASSTKGKDLSIATGRSMCTHCGHELQPLDLIPILSYVALQGKCRYCKKPIADTPLAEVSGLVLFVASYVLWPYGFAAAGIVAFCFWLSLLVVLLALTLYDIRWKILPNQLVYIVLGMSIVQRVVQAIVFAGGPNQIREAVLGLICFGGVFYVLFQLSDGAWIGGGDVKLGFGLGVLVGGPLHALLAIFLASVLGLVLSIPLLLRSREGHRLSLQIPFGPFLIVAAGSIYLAGPTITDWYSRLITIH